ncbi:Re/Si-specific NAD(P)(+) transhydrogenase subunit alpha [Sediminitomix flava]|uniref:NAD(P) transhydrogenase subunit alpha part 1 n=1 Tax=Sediminitomix flava TaxID=379075 RepID=A0A315ZNP2_SEDFL|nr:Re/Si-specific NAD(P)(+) transhydrogenase subunit alpha [Sediminitomix flava]PWJ36129.1 NAD(P) transhydrogenase subunit alpha [Sediminitomix flava]
MQIGVLKELHDQRVAITPDLVKKLVKSGHEVVFESGAGAKAFAQDDAYEAAGAKAQNREAVVASSDLLMTIKPIAKEEIAQLKDGAVLVSQFQPFQDAAVCDDFSTKNLSTFSFDMIPRTTIAQSMDILSSMASISGYKAVLKATEALPRYVPMLSSAAGTIPPSKVLILGAGVAGLQAIATAKRLGGQVEAFDTRAASKEEVMSLGAKFVEVAGAADDKGAGGYAVEQSEEYKQKQQALIKEKIQKADIVITTAQLRGRPAPTLITEEMVQNMKPGSVIVDLASSTGGNCPLTEDKKSVVKHGVTIIGDSELSDLLPEQASQLYSRNIENYLKIFLNEEGISYDFENQIIRESCLVFKGKKVYGDTDQLLPKKEEVAESVEA